MLAFFASKSDMATFELHLPSSNVPLPPLGKLPPPSTDSDTDLLGNITARTRGLLSEIATNAREQFDALQSRRSAASHRQVIDVVDAALDEHEPPEGELSQRLMETLQDHKPQEAEITALHGSLESLQSTLGAAYMLLAAEAKAETLQASLTQTHTELVETNTSSSQLISAHERCVADYADLRKSFEDARADAEGLATILKPLASSLGADGRKLLGSLLGRLGSSTVLVPDGEG